MKLGQSREPMGFAGIQSLGEGTSVMNRASTLTDRKIALFGAGIRVATPT